MSAVRLATPADAAALAQLRWRFKAEDGATGEPADVAVAERWIAERLAREDGWVVWVAEADGEVVGHVFLALVERVPEPFEPNDPLGYLTNFYVVPEHRGRGLGTELLRAVREYALARRLATVIVWPSERSAALYRREGFGEPEELLELAAGE